MDDTNFPTARHAAIRHRLDAEIVRPSHGPSPTATARMPTVDAIQRVLCRHFMLTRDELLSSRKFHEIVWPRQIGMFLARDLTRKSLPDIARRFGRSDHTTALHAVRKVRATITGDPAQRRLVERIKAEIAAATNHA